MERIGGLGWFVLGLVVVAGFAIAALLLPAGEELACRFEIAAAAAKGGEKATAASCLEFWANRYQTLFTGLVAVGAAVLVGWQAVLQTRALQNAEIASTEVSIQAIGRSLDALGEERALFRDTDSEMRAGAKTVVTLNNVREWVRRVKAAELPTSGRARFPDLQQERVRFREALDGLASALGEIGDELCIPGYVGHEETIDEKIAIEKFEAAQKQLRAYHRRWYQIADGLERALTKQEALARQVDV